MFKDIQRVGSLRVVGNSFQMVGAKKLKERLLKFVARLTLTGK